MGKWNKIKLGNACQISKGQQLNKIDLEKAGDYPCVNGGIEPSGYTDKWNTQANTITISEGGNSCGYVNFLSTRFWSGGHCYTLLELKANIDVNFLYQALKGRESLIMRLRVGSGLPNIQQKAIKEFEFEYPEEKSEQTRISQILDIADAAITQTEALIAKYQSIKTGLIQDLLTKGLDDHGNIRSEQTHRFKIEKGLRVPEEWEVLELKDLGQIVTGSTPPIKETENYGDDYCFITPVDLNENQFIHTTERKLSKKGFALCRQLPAKSISVVCIGSTIGKISMVEELSTSNQQVNSLVPFDLDLSDYYYYSMRAFLDIQLRREAGLQAVPIVNKTSFSKMILPIPKDKSEGLNIIRHLNKSQGIFEAYKNNLNKLQSLKTGLMQDLLLGKVRVKIT